MAIVAKTASAAAQRDAILVAFTSCVSSFCLLPSRFVFGDPGPPSGAALQSSPADPPDGRLTAQLHWWRSQ
jgi:hypothetical protein